MLDRDMDKALPLRPVRSLRLSEEIIGQIASLVAEGHIGLNDRLPTERALQARWQVSRPVLREAFRVLEMQGVIESRPGGGRYLRSTRVLDPTRLRTSRLEENRDVLLRIWEAREAVEGMTAALAAQRATSRQITRIEETLGLVSTLPREKLEELDLNGDFHQAVAQAAGNPVLEEIVCRLLRQSGQIGFKSIVGVDDWATLQAEHLPILNAIRRRDPKAASRAMGRHFENLRRRTGA